MVQVVRFPSIRVHRFPVETVVSVYARVYRLTPVPVLPVSMEHFVKPRSIRAPCIRAVWAPRWWFLQSSVSAHAHWPTMVYSVRSMSVRAIHV